MKFEVEFEVKDPSIEAQSLMQFLIKAVSDKSLRTKLADPATRAAAIRGEKLPKLVADALLKQDGDADALRRFLNTQSSDPEIQAVVMKRVGAATTKAASKKK